MFKKIKKGIKKIFLFFAKILPPKNCIVLESAPDLSDNTKAVFDEMIRIGVNKKHKFYWICYEEVKNDYPKIKNVKYISANSKLAKYVIARSRVALCCNRFIFSHNKNAFNMYLCHGNILKNTGYYIVPNEIQNILASSKGMKKETAIFYKYDVFRFHSLGFPRNDVFKNTHTDLHVFFGKNYKKIIVWYPTVRQFKTGRTTGSEHSLPIIWDEKNAIELNRFAAEHETLIVLKPHFAQDVRRITELNLSNIVLIDDSFFIKNHITSYQFLSSCDALLTDYSSVYYDYTLCDKPIGLVWEDYDEFKSNPGFAVNMEYMMKGGVKIYCLNDFLAFIQNVAQGKDTLKEQRREIRDYTNFSTDGHNAERVVSFIVEKAAL